MNETIKQLLIPIVACYIGPSFIDGCHWFVYKNEPKKDKQLLDLSQQIIRAGENVKDIYTSKTLQDGTKVITFNRNIFPEIIQSIMDIIYKEYPNFATLKNGIQFNEVIEKEKDILVDYITDLPLNINDIDVYLYKSFGNRVDTLILHEGPEVYKKQIHGFYLTENDIEDVNAKLSQYNKKIAKIIECECLKTMYGVRYTLVLTDADFIN